MKIYDFAASPNAYRVRAVAYELGLAPTYVHVNFATGDTRTPEFLAKNPNGRMPVLEDEGFVLWESNAIIAYLAAKHPEKGLIPSDARGRAEVDRWMFWQVSDWNPAFEKIVHEKLKPMFGGGTPDEAIIRDGVEQIGKLAAVLDGWLKDREYVAGKLSVADFGLMGFASLRQVFGVDFSAHPNVSAWLSRLEARESCRRALADGTAVWEASQKAQAQGPAGGST
jgi:glutathione S-transferase